MIKPFAQFFGGMRMSDNMTEPEPEVTETTEVTEEKKVETRMHGKLIKVAKTGYGFISSKEIPFTRIFFHWTSLKSDTLKFTELRSGMKVSFVAFKVEDQGYRAIKVKVET